MNVYVRRMIDHGMVKMATFEEFLQISQYSIDRAFVDRFFHNLDEHVPVYVDEPLLDYLGYSGEHRHKKRAFVDLLTSMGASGEVTSGEDFQIYTGSEYVQFYQQLDSPVVPTHSDPVESGIGRDLVVSTASNLCELELAQIPAVPARAAYPNPKDMKGLNKANHIFVTVDCLINMLQQMTTPKAIQVRKYFVALNKLVKYYIEYQNYFRQMRVATLTEDLVETRKTLDDMRRMIGDADARGEQQTQMLHVIADKLDIATEDRVMNDTKKQNLNTFILYRLNSDECDYGYYAIRTCKKGASRAIARCKKAFPNATQVYSIVYVPNAAAYFRKVKEHLQHWIVCSGNYIALAEDYEEEEFLDDLREIERSRKASADLFFPAANRQEASRH